MSIALMYLYPESRGLKLVFRQYNQLNLNKLNPLENYSLDYVNEFVKILPSTSKDMKWFDGNCIKILYKI